MLKVILPCKRSIAPFNEPARDLRIQNKPLWLTQRDILAPYTNRELELTAGARLPQTLVSSTGITSTLMRPIFRLS